MMPPSSLDAGLTIFTLGAGEPPYQADSVRLPAQAIRLIAYLNSQSGRNVTRNEICSLLWETNDETKARHSLSQLLYIIATKAPSVALTTTPQTIRLKSMVLTDLTRLELAIAQKEYEVIASLYHGSFLEDLGSVGTIEFERWRDAKAAEIWNRVCASYRSGIQELYEAGELDRCVRIGAFLSALDALDEKSEATICKAASPQSTFFKQNDNANTTSPKFVGRIYELTQLRTLTPGANGSLPIAVVRGEPGVGKTRLALHFGRMAAIKGQSIQAARCYEAERHVPFAMVVQLLSALQPTRYQNLPAITRSALAALHPRFLDGESAGVKIEAISKTFLFESITAAVRLECAGRNLVLIVDDSQWCDVASSEWLHHFYRSDEAHREEMHGIGNTTLPRTIILTYRSDLVDSNLHIRWAFSQTDAVIIDLEPLPAGDSEALLRNCLERDRISLQQSEVAQVQKNCLGNPLFIVAVADSIGRGDAQRVIDGIQFKQVPHAIRRLVSYRLERLSTTARLLAETLSCVSGDVPIQKLGLYTKLPQSELIRGIKELIAGRLIKHNELSLSFTHDLIGRSVYNDLSSFSQRMLHEQIYYSMTDEPPAIRANHSQKAGLRIETYRESILAAQNAIRVYAYLEALHYFDIAMQSAGSEDERCSATIDATQLLYDLRRYKDAATLAKRAIGFSEAQGATNAVTLCRLAIITDDFVKGERNAAQCYEDIHQLIEEASKSGSSHLVSQTLRFAMFIGHHIGSKEEFKAVFSRVEEVSESLDTSSRAELLAVLSGPIALLDRAEAKRISDRSLELALELNEPRITVLAFGMRGSIHTHYGEIEDALKCFDQAEAACVDPGLSEVLTMVHTNRACIYFDQGKFEKARTENRKAMQRSSHMPLLPLLNEAAANLDVGDSKNALMFANQAIDANAHLRIPWVELNVAALRGLALLQRGDFAAAEEEGERARTLLTAQTTVAATTDVSYTDVFLSHLDVRAGDRGSAVNRLMTALQSEYLNKFARCRIEIALAELESSENKDAAYRLAKNALDRATELGSAIIAAKASAIIERLR